MLYSWRGDERYILLSLSRSKLIVYFYQTKIRGRQRPHYVAAPAHNLLGTVRRAKCPPTSTARFGRAHSALALMSRLYTLCQYRSSDWALAMRKPPMLG